MINESSDQVSATLTQPLSQVILNSGFIQESPASGQRIRFPLTDFIVINEYVPMSHLALFPPHPPQLYSY